MDTEKIKVLIVGHGRHGKDTLANILNEEFGFKFRGSSQVAASEVVYPLMSNFYSSPEEAFERRHENRELWRALISDFNRDDLTKLSRLVCAQGYGYTGLRDKGEVYECISQGVFTHVIWVERPDLANDDSTMNFDFEYLQQLHARGLFKSLAFVSNKSEAGMRETFKRFGDLFFESELQLTIEVKGSKFWINRSE
jgi:hypothetical protein